jgi:hypothetical protein
MKLLITILLFPLFLFAQVDKEGTNQNGNYDRLVSASSLLGGKFFRGERIKARGVYGGEYIVTDVPNSLWNNNVEDSLFVWKVQDAAPNGRNGFRMSENLDNQTYWQRGGTPDGFSIIANSDIAPDGSRTAERFVYVNSNPLRGSTNTAITTGQSYTVSLYIKVPIAASNDDMKVRVELNNYSATRVTISPDIVNKGWARYSATFVANADNANADVAIDFGATGVDVGDTLVLWGLHFHSGTTATPYIRTEITPSVSGTLYAHYLPENGVVVLDKLYNFKNDPDYLLIQKAFDYCNAVNQSTVLLIQDRTLTDTIRQPINVHLDGVSTGNTVIGTYNKLKTKVFVDLNSTTKTAITFVGEGSDQLTGHGVTDIVFIPISDGYALINTGNTVRSTLSNIDISSWSTSATRWLNYGIIMGAGSLQNTIEHASFLHLKTAGLYSLGSAILNMIDVRVTEAVYGAVVDAAELNADMVWFENIDSSAVYFNGNICHLNRIYTEDVPKTPGTVSNTFHIVTCSQFTCTNSDLQCGDIPTSEFQNAFYFDDVRESTVAFNQIQSARSNLETTVNTGFTNWLYNVESNNSDVKVSVGFGRVFNRSRILILNSTGQNSFINTANWIPRLTAENAMLEKAAVTNGYLVDNVIENSVYLNSPTIKSSNENQYPYSEDLDQNFDYSGVYYTLTPNDTVSFNGLSTAEKLLQSTGTDHYIYRNLTGADTLLPGAYYTFSLYVANSGFNSIRLSVGGEDVDTIAVVHSPSWVRYSLSFRKDEATANNTIYYYFDGGSTNSYIHLDGYQFEKNIQMGEYVKTTGTRLTADPHFNLDGKLVFDGEVKVNSLGFNLYTATQASALTPYESLLIYVTDTNGTFTSKGFWGYTGAAWEKLNN